MVGAKRIKAGSIWIMSNTTNKEKAGQTECEAWEAEQEELKRLKKAAATRVAAASFCYLAFFLRGLLGLELGKIGAPLGKYSCS